MGPLPGFRIQMLPDLVVDHALVPAKVQCQFEKAFQTLWKSSLKDRAHIISILLLMLIAFEG
jgi:hypothetical protein